MNHKKEASWENILRVILRQRKQFSDLLTDDDQRLRVQFFCVFCIFFLVSSVMSVVNVVTGYDLLRQMTVGFALLNLLNIVLMLLSPATEKLTRYLFAVEIITLFTAFLIFGEPEGFSAVWIALLPACGLLMYRLKFGLLISGVQYLILIFLLWTEPGRSLLQFDYTASFLLRFPLLYGSFFMVGIFFEFIRARTNRELVETREKFEQLSKHDPLTGLYNRLGFYSHVEKHIEDNNGSCAFALLDFDHFKEINDTYGHTCGDVVLMEGTKIMQNAVGDAGCVCRWGGDEIAVYFYEKSQALSICETIMNTIEAREFPFSAGVFKTTISIGLTTVSPETSRSLPGLISAADTGLYLSKDQGRNRLSASEYAGE